MKPWNHDNRMHWIILIIVIITNADDAGADNWFTMRLTPTYTGVFVTNNVQGLSINIFKAQVDTISLWLVCESQRMCAEKGREGERDTEGSRKDR